MATNAAYDYINKKNTQAPGALSERMKNLSSQIGAEAFSTYRPKPSSGAGSEAVVKANRLAAKGLITDTQRSRMIGTEGGSPAVQAGDAEQPKTPDFEGMSQKTLDARMKAIQTGVEAGKQQYQRQIDNAAKEYDPLRNEAYTNDQRTQRQQQERLANMGLSATGGASMTMESNRAMSLQNRLGDISRQQQKLVDDANFQINQLVAQGKVDEAKAVSEETDKLNQQLVDDYYKTRDYKLQQDQFGYQKERDTTTDQQWQDQLDYTKGRDTVADTHWKEEQKAQKAAQASQNTVALLQSRLLHGKTKKKAVKKIMKQK